MSWRNCAHANLVASNIGFMPNCFTLLLEANILMTHSHGGVCVCKWSNNTCNH